VRRAALGVLIALLTVGCEASDPRTPPRAPTLSRAARPAPNIPQTPGTPLTESRLPRIVLIADLDQPPARWRPVAHIGFGPLARELGLFIDRERTSTPIYPPSFAVDPDGTIWILDVVKHRIAHYDRHGRFLGRAAGVRFERGAPLPDDIAFASDTMYLLSHRTPLAGVLQSVSDAGVQPPVDVVTRGHHPAVVTVLYPSAGPEILGVIEGRASTEHPLFGTGRTGIAELRGRDGEVRFLPGYPLADGTFMDMAVAPGSDQDLEVRYSAGRHRAVRPIHVRLKPGLGPPAIPAVVQFEPGTATAHGLLASVGVGPARTTDRGVGDGRWLLGVFDDGSPLIWERLPEQSLAPEWATRTLTVTPEGAIYLMLAQPDGVSIYRRPSRP
jgi:hypothetical protein